MTACRAINPRALAMSLCLVAACGQQQFSRRAEFIELRAERGANPPTDAERALLRRFKPRLFIAAQAEGPLDFYRDYIAHGVLSDGQGRLVAQNPDRHTLNEWRDHPAAVFQHTPADPPRQVNPVAYGGIRAAALTLAGQTRPITMLTYHYVFRASGLPRGIAPPLRWFARVFADPGDWHQLDHYTAAFVALDSTRRPFAVMLQQHNYLHTYLVGEEPAFPCAGAIRISAAIDSNELYPYRAGRHKWPAANFLTPAVADYLAGISDTPPFLRAAPDITAGVDEGLRQVDYRLEFPPPDDAFYVFQGYLGEQRLLPGRDGPPGAMYNTVPAFARPEAALPVFYWRPPDAEYARIIRAGDWTSPAVTRRLQERFAAALAARPCGGGP